MLHLNGAAKKGAYVGSELVGCLRLTQPAQGASERGYPGNDLLPRGYLERDDRDRHDCRDRKEAQPPTPAECGPRPQRSEHDVKEIAPSGASAAPVTEDWDIPSVIQELPLAPAR